MPTIADYRAKYPSLRDLDDSALIGRVAEVQGVDPEDVIAHMGYKPKARSLMAVANDTVIEAANATAGAVGSVADFIAPGNRVSSFIDEKIIRPGEAAQSDVAQQSRRQFQQEVEQADGIGGELMAVGRKVLRDPLLTAAQAAGSFVIPGLGVKAAGGVAGALGAGATGVARAGLAGGATAGAALSGGDAAGTAYDLVIKAGGSEQEAVSAARQASVLPAAVGGLGGMVGAERLLAGAGGVKGGIMARALKTAGIEGAQEGFEEGITQYEGQRAAMPFDSTIDPMKGVGAAAGMGAVMGGAIGGATGALSADPAEAERRLATAPDVGSMVQAATDLAMTPLATPAAPVRPRAAGADTMAEIRQLEPADQQEAIGLLDAANNQNAPGNVRRYAQNRLDELLLPFRQVPAGEMTELQPDETINADVAFMKFRSPQQIAEDGMPRIPTGEATEIERRAMGRGIPAGEATEMIPAGEASEVPDIPVGDLSYIEPESGMAPRSPRSDGVEIDPAAPNAVAGYIKRMASTNTPAARAFVQDYRAGRITGADVLSLIVPSRRADPTPDERIAAAAAQAPTIQPGDLLTGDGMPYGTKSAASVRATREGGGSVIEVPGGYVVRKESPSEPVTDLAGIAGRTAGAADGRGDQPGGSRGVVRPVPDGAGGLVQVPAAPVAGGAANAVLADGARQPDPALTPGARVNFDGKTWTVIDASPSMIRLDDGQGTRRAISSTSAKWKQVTQAEPSQPVEAGQGAADAAQVDQPAGAALLTDALIEPAGPTNTASWVIREKSTGKVVMETFDRKKVDALNTDRYEAVPAQQYLSSLSQRPDAQPATSTTRDETPAPTAAAETTSGVPAAGPAGVEADGVEVRFSQWTDIGSGYQARQSTTHPTQQIKTPGGNIITRGLDTNGKEYTELEGSGDPAARGAMAWVDKAQRDLKALALPKLAAPATEAPAAAAGTPGGAVEADGLTDPFKLDKATLNRELDKIVASGEAGDLIGAFTALRRKYEKASGKKSIPPAGSRYLMLPDEPAGVEADGVKQATVQSGTEQSNRVEGKTTRTDGRDVAELVPIFEDYDSAQAWIESKAKEYGGKQRFSASRVYGAVYGQIKPLYDATKAADNAARMAALADAGLKIGDSVEMRSVGMFLNASLNTGTLVDRGGAPFVKINGEMTFSKNGRLSTVKSIAWDARWKAAPNATAPVEAASTSGATAPGAVAPDDGPFAELFGTRAEQEAAQERFMADQTASNEGAAQAAKQQRADAERIRGAITAEKQRAMNERDEWAAKVYKKNATQVDLQGDGPSSRSSMSIGAINESKRRNAVEALTQEIGALDKLGRGIATDEDAAQLIKTMRDLMGEAERAVESGNWPGQTADAMFQSMLLDDLKFRGPGGRGSVTSNGLSRAVLGATKANVSTNGEKTNTSAERVQETPESEQVAPLKDRVEAMKKPAAPTPAGPEAAAPAADTAPAPKPTPVQPAEKPEPKPKRPPKSFRKTHTVTTSVFVEESGKFEQREVDADTALKALDEDVAEMTAFRKCLTGG